MKWSNTHLAEKDFAAVKEFMPRGLQRGAQAKTGDTLDVYWGEFLTSPVPLEIGFNLCSHACVYCFANLNKPGRYFGLQTTLRTLQSYESRDTLLSLLLKKRYPVLASNRVDPFAASNHLQAVPVLQQMAEMDIPLAFQTKGGTGWEWFAENLPPSCWYITITTSDEEIRKRIEPGAPSIQSRFEMAEVLMNRGHYVTVGMNPLVPEWCPEPNVLLRWMRGIGISTVWIEKLHFNYAQIAAMTSKMKEALSPPIIKRALQRKISRLEMDTIMRVSGYAREWGMQVFSNGYPFPTSYWSPYYALYKETFPVNQQFVNWAYAGRPDRVTFNDYWNVMKQGLPKGKLNIGHYLGATSHSHIRKFNFDNWMTYRQLLAFIWREFMVRQCPGRMPCFDYIRGRDGEAEVDASGLPILRFVADWEQEYFRQAVAD